MRGDSHDMIDMHVHPMHIAELWEEDPGLGRAVDGPFGLHGKPTPLESFLFQLEYCGVDHAVLLPLDCTASHGCVIVRNEALARLVADQPRLIGFASVDPNQSDAAKRLRDAVEDLGLRGLKLDPSLQGFDIDDEEAAYPVYAACVELGVPLVMHCGLSWAPEGRSSRAHPLRLEPVVHQFPDLRVVIAHCGYPWVDDALLLALKYEHVYLDTAIIYAGTPVDSLRRVFGERIGVDIVDRALHHKLVFGSNYPRVEIKRMVGAVRALGFHEWLEERVFHHNAADLLGLTGARS